jgi:hypothetical protein
MDKLSATALLAMTALVLAEPSPSRGFLSTFDECDTECFDEYLGYGYTEGYAKYTCCFSYRLELKKAALSSLSAANLDRKSLICDQDCYRDYSTNGFSEEMSLNKCCFSNEDESVKLYRIRSHSSWGGSSHSSSSSSSGYHYTSSHSSWSSSGSGHLQIGSFRLERWQIVLLAILISAIACGVNYIYRKRAVKH